MRIGIFTNVLVHRPSGIGWHVIHLLNHLAEIDRTNTYFLFYRTPAHDPRRQLFKPTASNFHNVPIPTPDLFFTKYFRFFDRWIFPRVLARYRLDVFHGPNHYLPPRHRVPQVVTYHDVAEANLHCFPLEHRKRQQRNIADCLARADHVVAPSDCTRRDLVAFGYPHDKVAVIHQGGNNEALEHPPQAQICEVRAHFGIRHPFVLFVGSLGPRKNVGMLLRAFACLRQKRPRPLHLVLAGASDPGEVAPLRRQAEQLGVAEHVIFSGYLSNHQMRGLYGGASVLAMPSLYEGFGMTVLEAMAYDLPVVSTRGGALPEVVGDAGVLVDVGDHEAMAAALGKVLDDRAFAADLVARGQRRRVLFQWRNTAEQTLAIYQQIGG